MDTTNEGCALYLEPYDSKRLVSLCGHCGENLKLIESRLNVEIHSRGNYFEIFGSVSPHICNEVKLILQSLYVETLQDSDLTPHSVHLKILEYTDHSIKASEAFAKTAAQNLEFPLTHLMSTSTALTFEQDLNTDHTKTIDPFESTSSPHPADPRSTMDKQMARSVTSSNHIPAENWDLHEAPPKTRDRKKEGFNEIHTHRKVIRLRSQNQKIYAQNIAQYDINFGIGPAGTGKTYLAVAAAVSALQSDEVKRILLVRPAVEAGEKLGFLPGDLSEKVNPYLRPLYDALYEMLGFEQVAKLIDRQVIEVCPLAYMRGRTLSDAFIILDESQNTTPAQMKMLLTRIGFGSKAVITGDVTQIDLPKGQESGLRNALQVLRGVQDIGVTQFESSDVVRHPLVKTIIDAYDGLERSKTHTYD